MFVPQKPPLWNQQSLRVVARRGDVQIGAYSVHTTSDISKCSVLLVLYINKTVIKGMPAPALGPELDNQCQTSRRGEPQISRQAAHWQSDVLITLLNILTAGCRLAAFSSCLLGYMPDIDALRRNVTTRGIVFISSCTVHKTTSDRSSTSS